MTDSLNTNTTAHHVVIVPDTRLATCKMNSTNITTGAYVGSDFYTGANDNVDRSSAIDIVNSAFGAAHILSHRVVLTSATTNGYALSGTWYDATVELMTERMVYGNPVYENVLHGTNNPFNTTMEKSQLPLFALEHSRIGCRQDYWLRSVANSTQFCCVGGRATTLMAYANDDKAVRPAFAIYQA